MYSNTFYLILVLTILYSKDEHNSASSRPLLRKREKNTEFERHQAGSHRQNFLVGSSRSTTTEDEDEDAFPPVPILSDLEVCFVQNDFTAQYYSNGISGGNSATTVSNIPVPDGAFNDGLSFKT
jgi:hypothetical protein